MKILLTGRSEIAVTPTNWNTKKGSIKKPWKIHYRFYEGEGQKYVYSVGILNRRDKTTDCYRSEIAPMKGLYVRLIDNFTFLHKVT